MYVELVFEPPNSKNVFLKRMVRFDTGEANAKNNESIYLIQREAKTKEEYREYLKSSGIDPATGSFWLSQSKLAS